MLVFAIVPVELKNYIQNTRSVCTGSLFSFDALNSILDVQESVITKRNTKNYVTFFDIENGIEKKTKTNARYRPSIEGVLVSSLMLTSTFCRPIFYVIVCE